MTKFYKKEYPRPQFVRDNYIDLNGKWHFAFDCYNDGETKGWYRGFDAQHEIKVPFCYESQLSGVADQNHCNSVWYERKVSFPVEDEKRVLLILEGCDYLTKVWVNGCFVGEHTGGYTRFRFDITNQLSADGEADIVIQAKDSMDATQPRGKQRWLKENYDCWYTQTTGIWKSVWAECVSAQRIDAVKITPQYDTSSVEFAYTMAEEIGEKETITLETVITYGDLLIYQGSDRLTAKYFIKTLTLINQSMKWKMETWSPEHPNLYDAEFKLYRDGILLDRVGSYFGVRKISTDTNRVTLNNMELHLKMVLDQGYWADGLLTPPNEEALVTDLKKVLEYGYNGVRKHQKIEDERFYYWADVLGMLVWCESPSTYEFNDSSIEKFTKEWTSIVQQHYNHPSIITWVPFNESWGLQKIYTDLKQQQFTEGIYHLTKAIDNTRPVIVNDGWEHTVSDIITLHDYAQSGEQIVGHWNHLKEILEGKESFNGERFAFAKGYQYQGQPIMISEFGGIAFSSQDGWGYGGTVQDEESFLKRFSGQIKAIESLDFVCGYCYTELTDVQQEVNGHMDMQRQDKIAPEKIHKIISGD